MPLEKLLARINADNAGDKIDAERLAKMLPQMGAAVEELAEVQQYVCGVCGKAYDRTEAQGAPLLCTHCGADFRAQPDALRTLGGGRVVRLDLLAVRPDIFDIGGMARFVRGYLGIRPGLIEYPVAPPKLRVKVDPRLAEESSRRPFIACAVLRNVTLDSDLVKLLMNLQEDLHWALGRDRKLASIGVYDMDTFAHDLVRYDAVDPDSLRFVPLGFDPSAVDSALTPREILERHKTGQEYAHLLKAFTHYPLLHDGQGTVLSMPPIINSEKTRVTQQSRTLFCDVTGLAQRSVDRALNVIVTSLREMLPDLVIEGVTIEAADGERVTPDLAPTIMPLDQAETSATIGVELDAQRLVELLARMGHGVAEQNGSQFAVRVPAYRNDCMHPIDLIEDVAIAYGYANLVPALVPTSTVGKPREIEEQCAIARRAMTGLGFHQVMTLTLTSEPAAFDRWRVPHDPRAVQIEHPISVEQTICRVSLLPGLLETLAINKQYDLPQHLFEIGDCCFLDETVETGAREERFAAAAMIGTHVGYADIRAVCDAFCHEMAAPLTIRPIEHASYIPGRAAELVDRNGRAIGTMGEVHPEVLEAYGLKHPVSVLELSLAKLLER